MFNKKICVCTIVNILIITFIIIVSFYLLRRLNRINIKKKEQFVSSYRPVIKNVIDVRSLAEPLNVIADKLGRIDAKLDYVTGFKNIKEDKKKNKTPSIIRTKYP